jgi:hypothetical protein
MKNGWNSLICALLISFAATSVFASPTAVDNVYMAFGSNIKYYTGATQQLGFTSAVASGKLQSAATPTPGTYDYLITNATFTFYPDLLKTDMSSGGIAKGAFAGGGSITLTGNIKQISTGTIIYSNQTLLTADMSISSLQTWNLEEQGSYMIGSVYFTPVGGVLHDGTLLNMGDFRLAFKALPTVNPSNFSTDQTCMTTGIEITAVPVPEPATLMVIGLGGLLLRRYRR